MNLFSTKALKFFLNPFHVSNPFHNSSHIALNSHNLCMKTLQNDSIWKKLTCYQKQVINALTAFVNDVWTKKGTKNSKILHTKGFIHIVTYVNVCNEPVFLFHVFSLIHLTLHTTCVYFEQVRMGFFWHFMRFDGEKGIFYTCESFSTVNCCCLLDITKNPFSFHKRICTC